ncbi:hypothetical protein Agabi119p4_7556 [Agaricus bisporus var. burnettii]|uniref:Peptidase S28 n=1 Tax=Agaricus bisporus var. burnettii TaxID=192524 RepID=A0A8H7C8A5_AGABI|nr:hypothetical protein Agabi119p4_7556 [Agaricus bisporus var. burnettii]
MTRFLLPLLLLGFTSFTGVNSFSPVIGPQGVNFWNLDKQEARERGASSRRDLSLEISARAFEEFEPQWFEQPLDHFDESNPHTFKQRYWVSKRHYKARQGAPVFVLDGGETSGANRLPFLDTGIVDILARATEGLGVILEHRYYGASIAVENLTTDALRWLNNEQAAADSANFMAKVKFEGIEEDLTAPSTPWIYYGGSYAGARSAHMKILYPDLVYGAIASSAVTHAAVENWQYMEIIRKAADPKCSHHLENSIKIIDSILLGHSKFFKSHLKGLFGLANLTHDDDFASTISSPLGSWQSKNWDPEESSERFDQFCEALNAPVHGHGISAKATDLPFGDPARMVEVADGLTLDLSILNYGAYIKNNTASRCRTTLDDCFGTYDDSKYQQTGLDEDWRLWMFQVCTQWGYFTTTPPDPKQPRILSRLITLPHESKICQQAYLPGEFFQVPPLPNVTAVNMLGDFDIAADRLMFVDGEVDPWRPDTPHSDDAKPRDDTILRPFKLIPGAVHHWDENGLADVTQEPVVIQDIHAEEVAIIEQWLADWKPPTKKD